MKTSSHDTALFAEKIAATEVKLEHLAQEIAEIGQPAGNHLQHRLDALKVEEHALQRNFAEVQEPDKDNPHRREQLEALLEYIEKEEASLEHAADFLHQASPSSVTLAAETGSRIFGAIGRGMKRVLRGRHPFGSSVFVNNSYDTLVKRHGLQRHRSDLKDD